MAKKVLNLDTDTGAESWGSVDADNVVLDTTNFDKNLDTTITDVQKLADAVDDLDLGSGGSLPSGTVNGTFLVWNSTTSLWEENINIEISADYSNSIKLKELYYEPNIYFSNAMAYITPEGVLGRIPTIAISNDEDGARMRISGSIVVEKYSGSAIRTAKTINDTYTIMFDIDDIGNITSNSLVGTGDRPVVADSDGKLKIGTTANPVKIEHLSEQLTGTEYTVSRETLGITGDLRDRIKQMKVWIKNASGGDLRTDSTAGEYIAEDFISVDFNTDLSGNYVKIILYID